jgi:hypothetical protein
MLGSSRIVAERQQISSGTAAREDDNVDHRPAAIFLPPPHPTPVFSRHRSHISRPISLRTEWAAGQTHGPRVTTAPRDRAIDPTMPAAPRRKPVDSLATTKGHKSLSNEKSP